MSENNEATRADICAAAVADIIKGDGEIMVSPMSPCSKLGALLARETFEPDIVLTDGANRMLANNMPLGSKDEPVVEGWMPFPLVFDMLWWGKRHVIMGATQIDQYGNQNLAFLGEYKQPKVQLLGVRGAPGNTINHTTSYFVGNHTTRVFVPEVDCVAGVGYSRTKDLSEANKARHEIRAVVTNLCVIDFQTEDNRARVRSLHPGVTAETVRENTGFDIVIADDVPETRTPTAEEIAILRRMDPNGWASKEVKV